MSQPSQSRRHLYLLGQAKLSHVSREHVSSASFRSMLIVESIMSNFVASEAAVDTHLILA